MNLISDLGSKGKQKERKGAEAHIPIIALIDVHLEKMEKEP